MDVDPRESLTAHNCPQLTNNSRPRRPLMDGAVECVLPVVLTPGRPGRSAPPKLSFVDAVGEFIHIGGQKLSFLQSSSFINVSNVLGSCLTGVLTPYATSPGLLLDCYPNSGSTLLRPLLSLSSEPSMGEWRRYARCLLLEVTIFLLPTIQTW